MINQVFGAIAALGSAEAQNLLALAGENVLKKYRGSSFLILNRKRLIFLRI